MSESTFDITPLAAEDFEMWEPLWDDNNQGHRSEDVTNTTWGRLIDKTSDVHGLAARLDGRIIGFLHYILHPVTGHIQPVCYMQDVYVAPPYRNQGVAKVLIGKLSNIGQEQKWGRIYWLAEADNAAAQALYKNIGVKLNFTLHVLPLQ